MASFYSVLLGTVLALSLCGMSVKAFSCNSPQEILGELNSCLNRKGLSDELEIIAETGAVVPKSGNIRLYCNNTEPILDAARCYQTVADKCSPGEPSSVDNVRKELTTICEDDRINADCVVNVTKDPQLLSCVVNKLQDKITGETPQAEVNCLSVSASQDCLLEHLQACDQYTATAYRGLTNDLKKQACTACRELASLILLLAVLSVHCLLNYF